MNIPDQAAIAAAGLAAVAVYRQGRLALSGGYEPRHAAPAGTTPRPAPAPSARRGRHAAGRGDGRDAETAGWIRGLLSGDDTPAGPDAAYRASAGQR